MPYQEIAQAILRSSEIRIQNSTDLDRNGALVRALAFVFPEGAAELSLEDKGGYLELNLVPILLFVDCGEVDEWRAIPIGVIQYIEILERWFVAEPSQLITSRFAGFKVIGTEGTFEINVDDDTVGAFAVRVCGKL